MNQKEMLKKRRKKRISPSPSEVSQKQNSQIVKFSEKNSKLDIITLEIKSSLEELQDIYEWWKDKKERVGELKKVIIEKLTYIRDNRKELLGKIKFEDYLTNEVGISRGYFYDNIKAYNLCIEYKKPELFNEVDYKILVNIANTKDKNEQKNLLKNAKNLSRNDFKKVRPADFSNIEDNNDLKNIILLFLNKYAQKIQEENYKDEFLILTSIYNCFSDFLITLKNSKKISDEDLNELLQNLQNFK